VPGFYAVTATDVRKGSLADHRPAMRSRPTAEPGSAAAELSFVAPKTLVACVDIAPQSPAAT
jgi:hypothetical protein